MTEANVSGTTQRQAAGRQSTVATLRQDGAGLIVDLGANNGDDTDFYLRKGFSVVAVEANPALCKKLRERFAGPMADGLLAIEQVGVSDRFGELKFFVNEDWSDWSSFLQAGKATKGRFSEIVVETVPLSHLLRKYGCPFYVKIDIEGYEKQSLATLPELPFKPSYLSWEINGDWTTCLEHVASLGCTGCKLVRQGKGYLAPSPHPPLIGNYVPVVFHDHMSGLFGEEVPGEWVTLDEIRVQIEQELLERPKRLALGQKPGWHDVHCRFI